MGDDAPRRQAVDGRLDLVEAAHPAQVVPVRGQRAGPGRGRFLLHDERRLQPGLHALDLFLLDALLQPAQLGQHDVERFLGALVGGAGVAEDAGPVLEGLVAGPDGVAQAAFLAHLGEQPGAHAAGEHVDRPHGRVVVGVADRHAGIGDGDLRLGRVLGEVAAAGRRAGRPHRAGAVALPVAEEPAHLLAQRLPLDVAGDRQDGPGGLEHFLPVGAASWRRSGPRCRRAVPRRSWPSGGG